MNKKLSLRGGYLLIQALVFGTIGLILIGALASWGAVNLRSSRSFAAREQAFHIAEAGIEYYRWHLAHAPTDYKDGQSGSGPYVHTYKDKDGAAIGTFTLTITPPAVGSTIVTVLSEGRVTSDPTVVRRIESRLAIPSIAKYAFVANSDMRFGEGTIVYGPIHSNQGVRFDGLAYNVVSSAKAEYDDPDHTGANEFGVHTHVTLPSGNVVDSFRASEAPPTNPVPVRTDVFVAGREFPLPAVDFNGFTSDLATIKSQAQASGRYFANSGRQGYRVQFLTNDTFRLYRVNTLRSAPNGCSNTQNQTGWGTWSIATAGNAQTLLGTYNLPANGLIFLEDNVWVDGQINTARVTLASARFPENPSTYTNITVNEDLKYTNYDGRDVLSLIAQNDVNVGLYSDTDLQIDAALVAKNGRVGRYYYPGPNYSGNRCSPYHVRNSLTLFGMIGTNERYGFAYTDGNGYDDRIITYDGNLLYGPPPSFPLTSDHYETISWREL